jgi:hypothetical protein
MALRHVTATDVGGALVLKLIDEQIRSEPMCLNRAVRRHFQRSNSWIIVIIHGPGLAWTPILIGPTP